MLLVGSFLFLCLSYRIINKVSSSSLLGDYLVLLFFQPLNLTHVANNLVEILNSNAPIYDELYFCHLHETFNEDTLHSCVFCNLSDNISELRSFLEDAEYVLNHKVFFHTYILLLNVLGEKINLITDLIKYNKTLKTISETRKWANFIKHPKSFLYIHHPEYIDSNYEDKGNFSIIIDSSFVRKYYSGYSLNSELEDILKNKTNVAVEMPNLYILTQGFCDDINTLIVDIKSSSEYIEKLKSITIHQNLLAYPHSESE